MIKLEEYTPNEVGILLEKYKELQSKLDCAVKALEDMIDSGNEGYMYKRARIALEEINKSNYSELPTSSKKEN